MIMLPCNIPTCTPLLDIFGFGNLVLVGSVFVWDVRKEGSERERVSDVCYCRMRSHHHQTREASSSVYECQVYTKTFHCHPIRRDDLLLNQQLTRIWSWWLFLSVSVDSLFSRYLFECRYVGGYAFVGCVFVVWLLLWGVDASSRQKKIASSRQKKIFRGSP